MKKLLSVLAIAAILVACNDAAQAPETEAPAPQEAPAPVETPAQDSIPAQDSATAAPAETPAAQ